MKNVANQVNAAIKWGVSPAWGMHVRNKAGYSLFPAPSLEENVRTSVRVNVRPPIVMDLQNRYGSLK